MKVWKATNRVYRLVKQSITYGVHIIKKQYDDSSNGIEWMANILVPVTASVQCMGMGLPGVLEFLMFALVALALLMLIRGIIVKVTKPVCKPYFRTILNGLFLMSSIAMYLFTTVLGRVASLDILVYSLLVTLLECLFFRSLYTVCKLKRRMIIPIITFGLTGLLNIVLCIFLFTDGYAVAQIREYQKLATSTYTVNTDNMFAEALKDGNYTVNTIDYGMDEEDDFTSETINLSSYLWDSTGIKKWTRERYLGYDSTEVPLRGRIYYPEEAKNCPVIFIVHGNHNLITDSYLGYGYLGEHLASRGYVVVSVDENACNFYWPEGLSGENAGRAYLLLENMRVVQTYNNSGPLQDKLDYNKLALIGHSRGGEAVALAALYNQLGHNPDVGYQHYDYHFAISSVIAIAPSVDQYKPSGRDVELTDVNYLLLQGSNDQDVSNFMGMKQYNNVEFTGAKDCYKSYLYIAGANHGQFNTTWEWDYPFPRNLMLNNADLITSSEQRDVLAGYVTAFVEDTLCGKVENRTLFEDNNHTEEALPDTIYISNYEDSSFVTLADYEEDISLDTATIEKGICVSNGLCFNNEQSIEYYTNTFNFPTDNHAAYLWWNRKGVSYGLHFTGESLHLNKNDYLQFDVADTDEERLYHEITELTDFTVELTDVNGKKADVKLSDICNVYPPLLVRLYKLQTSENMLDIKKVFQTVRIPLQMFQMGDGVIDLSNIVSIDFVFDRMEEGRVLIDNIGISNKQSALTSCEAKARFN